MKSYLCKVLVEIPDSDFEEWDSNCDFMFHSEVGALHNGETSFLVEYYEVPNDSVPKYGLFTEEGGI